MAALSGFTIPLAFAELPPAESLSQSVDNLNQLTVVINDIFSRLTQRIATERSKINSISDRVARASYKVQQIGNNQTKVTTICSAAKYPGPSRLPDYPSIVSDQDLAPSLSADGAAAPTPFGKYKLTRELRMERPVPTDTSELFHELSMANAVRAERASNIELDGGQEGLGRLPTYLPSVSSVLLFNSGENPYKKYESFNNLEGVAGRERSKKTSDLFSAPATLVDGTELPAFIGLQFDYKPDLGSVPTFQLPQNLPLAHLADISFGTTLGSIAPSTTSLLTLPTFNFEGLPAPARQKQTVSAAPQLTILSSSSTSSASSSSASSSTSTSTLPPPPPPPPSQTMSTLPPPPGMSTLPPPPNFPPPPTMNQSSLPPPPPPTTTSTLPPPPNMAPPASTLPPPPNMAPPAPKAATAKTSTLPEVPAGRGGLLADIRKGMQLRRTSTVESNSAPRGRVLGPDGKPVPSSEPEPAQRPAPPPSRAGPMDMMAALRENLARRAHLISGKDLDSAPKVTLKPPAPSPTSVTSPPVFDTDLKAKVAAAARAKNDSDDDDDDDGDW